MTETRRSTQARRSAAGELLERRSLNRAALARQFLLDRTTLSTLDVVSALVGLNAQNADPPYFGLWTRMARFRPDMLEALLHDRAVVRACLMRYTQHLVAARDFALLRSVVGPVLERVQRNAFGRRTRGVDLGELVAEGTELLRGRTSTRPELGRSLARRWPQAEASALAWSFQYLAPVVHPPPDGLWGRRGGHTPFALAEDWIGEPVPVEADRARFVLRYLAAFGPASVRDVQAWSGLSGLRAVVDDLRPRLLVFRDESGVELFDLPDAPRPDPATPCPPRFLPEFDNLVLAYADRSRIMTREHRSRVCVGAAVAATLLVDGFVCGTWTVERDRDSAVLAIEVFDGPPAPDLRSEVVAEGERLLRFAAPDAGRHEVRLA